MVYVHPINAVVDFIFIFYKNDTYSFVTTL